eukprot:CAMPEP_0197437758 /NCGR_PEP_ID=MMETSP1175-20131217/4920_1 /TAXON_ID=1003142 /ORGANISM="Triceratium dubium, Strain CCMP147" /LENGTH=276 /DNA_ID=CAMNT_0042967355 /DNA_START=194 /DNA_END=1024 /DNA_ORIENTATION=-
MKRGHEGGSDRARGGERPSDKLDARPIPTSAGPASAKSGASGHVDAVMRLLRDAISSACLGAVVALPEDAARRIVSFALATELGDLPEWAFREGHYRILSSSLDAFDGKFPDCLDKYSSEGLLRDDLWREQMEVVYSLQSNRRNEETEGEGVLEPWGEDVHAVATHADLATMWCRVGLPIGWIYSDTYQEYDMWLFAEFHHWHAPFVFRAGTTELVLRYDPVQLLDGTGVSSLRSEAESKVQKMEFTRRVTRRHHNRAEEVSRLVESIMFRQMLPE